MLLASYFMESGALDRQLVCSSITSVHYKNKIAHYNHTDIHYQTSYKHTATAKKVRTFVSSSYSRDPLCRLYCQW